MDEHLQSVSQGRKDLMIVDCPSCEQQYELGDDQVIGKSVILSCPPCNTSWIVGPIGTAPAVTSSADESSPVKMFGASQLPPAPPPMPPMGVAPQMDQDLQTPARRVHRGNQREQRDLFASQLVTEGRIQESAAANVRVGAESRAINSGGTGERNEHSVLFTVDSLRASTMRPPPPSANGASSPPPPVFSRQTNLSAMTAQQNAQYESHAPAAHDDGGMIDLAPMLASGGTMRPRSEPLYTPVGDISPMGFAMSVAPAKKSPFAMIAGISAAALVVLGVVLGVALHGGKTAGSSDAAAELAPPPSRFSTASNDQVAGLATPDSNVAAPSPSNTTTASTANTINTASAPVADATPAAQSSSASTGKSQGWRPTTRAVKSKSSATTRVQSSGTASASFTPKASAPPKPAKASAGGGKKAGGADACNCGGNLQCAMKCGL